MAQPTPRLPEICRIKGCSDTQILDCAAESGGLKELLFCHKDGCFVVKKDGRERLCTDSQDAAIRFYENL